MSWKLQMFPASFRGASFGVTDDSKQSGRRTIVHEFPQREEAYVEDLGMSNPTFTMQAFCLGSGYMGQRDALEAALQQPGPGTLVHPWYGSLNVSQAAPYTVVHSAENGGMCVFTITFAQDGAPSSPSTEVNSPLRALDKITAAADAAITAFDTALTIAGQVEYVVNAAYSTVTGVVNTVQSILSGNIGTIAGVLGAVTGYDFLKYASFGQYLYGVFEGMGDGLDTQAKATLWQEVANSLSAPDVAENAGSMRTTIFSNAESITAFAREVAILESAKAMAQVVPTSRGDAKILRESFMDSMDSLMLYEPVYGPPMSTEVYTALTEVRATTLQAMAIAAKATPDIITYRPAAVLPAEVIAHRLTQDIQLAPDLVQRNGIIHPAFVPVEDLEVLL